MITITDGLRLRPESRVRTVLLFILAVVLTLTLTAACKKEKPKPQAGKEAAKAQAQAPVPKPPEKEEKKLETETYSYSTMGRRDPFLSIIEASKATRDAEKKKKSLKPSEAYDARDVRVIAIARDKNRYYAMVQLPDNKYFTVKVGTTLGIYGGKVIKIDAGSVVVREYIKDYKGDIQPKDIILQLRKEGGE